MEILTECQSKWPHLDWKEGNLGPYADQGDVRFKVYEGCGGVCGFLRNVATDQNITAPDEYTSVTDLYTALAHVLVSARARSS